MFRFLYSLLVALALFVSPLSMLGDGGTAMAHGSALGAADGHCPDMPQSKKQNKNTLDCSSICSAIAAAPAPVMKPFALAGVTVPMLQHALAGVAPESEKPPPRIS